MELTVEALREKREALEAQKRNAFAVYQQAAGAVQLIDHLMEEIDKQETEPADGQTT